MPRSSIKPSIVVLGGPNGAGKTTISKAALAETFGLTEFVNADTIARGLSAFDPEGAAIGAGRVMLARLHDLAARRESFAFESTLASRTFARWLGELATQGYGVHVVYVWLRSPKLAVRRVKRRVREGGHSIPDDVIERRYARSCANLLELYLPLAESWRIIDNSGRAPAVVAFKKNGEAPSILLPRQWSALHEAANRNPEDPAEDV